MRLPTPSSSPSPSSSSSPGRAAIRSSVSRRVRSQWLGLLAVVLTILWLVPIRAASADVGSAVTGTVAMPVTEAVPLERRPDIAALFDTDVATLRARAATSMSRTVTERFGPLTAELARQLGRNAYLRPADVALYAVPERAEAEPGDDGRATYSIVAVPRHARVASDGTVSPPPPSSVGLVDPTFSTRWGDEDYFTWELMNYDSGGYLCDSTTGRVRGQWEYARISGVAPTSAYDYWGVAQRSVAEITKESKRCKDAIDWFLTRMQSRTPGAYGARQSPLTQPSGSCVTVNLSVSGSFSGVSASISQPVQKCEVWRVDGALAPSASTWYGIRYDNGGVWGKFQRETAALQILRVPRGAGHGLNTQMDLDVDNQ